MAAAAQAGYHPAAFDIFNDAETRRFCSVSRQVKYGEQGFDADDLLTHLQVLPQAPVLYGSGLEQQPELLDKIAGRYPVMGNLSPVVSQLKNPRLFFPLLDQLNIAYPPTCFDRTEPGWLVKRGGGAGGTHVRRGGPVGDGEYAQQEIPGQSLSVLFLAEGREAQIIGFNEQFIAPESGLPFCYGGAVSQAQIPGNIKAEMVATVQKIVAATGLRGLNSMDVLVSGGRFFVLEINPRLSGTFSLYDGPWLLRQHLQACAGVLDQAEPPVQPARAQKIVFTAQNCVMPDTWGWPDWVADIPVPGSFVQAQQPLCSVFADGPDAKSAKAMVFARAAQLEAQLRPLFLKGNPHEPHTS